MKTKAIFWVIFCMVAVILSSCSDIKDYEYVKTVKIEAIISHASEDHSFNDLVYVENNEVKTVKLASKADKAFRLQEFRPGDEVLLYKNGSHYYIASEEITQEAIEKAKHNELVDCMLVCPAIVVVLLIFKFIVISYRR